MAQKPSFLTKLKSFHQTYNLPSQSKFWSAISGQYIELESYSNSLKTSDVLWFRIKKKRNKLWVWGFESMGS